MIEWVHLSFRFINGFTLLPVLLEDSQRTEKYTSATYLQNHQVPALIDAKHAIAHNKVTIIDSTTTITGSFNFTKSAEESSAQNLLVIRDAWVT